MGFFGDLKAGARRQGAPVTVALAIALVGAALFFWLLGGRFWESLALTARLTSQPWALLTYPFAYTGLNQPLGPILVIFLVMWLFWVGGSVERDIGRSRYIALWLALTALGGLSMWVGSLLAPVILIVAGPALPIAGLTVAWASRNPTAIVHLYCILPVAGKWIGWLSVATILFGYGAGAPLLGVFACIPLLAAWAFASGRIPFLPYTQAAAPYKPSRGQQARDNEYFEDVRRREKEREERERLRKLFEGSVRDEDG